MAYTIYDIAKLAHTSPSTVSRYINNKPLKPENYKRIKEVMDKIDFKPNAMARALVSQTLKTVAIFTIDIRVPHFASTVYALEQEFSLKGYHVIICNVSSNPLKSIEYLKRLSNTKLDAVVFVGSIFNELNNNNEIKELLNDHLVILANGKLNLNNSYSLLVDDNKGIYKAFEYLYKIKHRKNILYFKDLNTSSSNLKEEGFINACNKYNIDIKDKIYTNIYDIDSGKQIIKKLIENEIEFDGIICGEDQAAIGVINQLKDFNIKVGKDVDVIGYNNTIYSEMISPKLTVIDNKPELQSKIIVEMIDNYLINKTKIESKVIEPELIIKESA